MRVLRPSSSLPSSNTTSFLSLRGGGGGGGPAAAAGEIRGVASTSRVVGIGVVSAIVLLYCINLFVRIWRKSDNDNTNDFDGRIETFRSSDDYVMNTDDQQHDHDHEDDDDEEVIREMLPKLSIHDWIDLYNATFNSNKHQFLITRDNIVNGDEHNNTSNDEEHDNNNNKDQVDNIESGITEKEGEEVTIPMKRQYTADTVTTHDDSTKDDDDDDDNGIPQYNGAILTEDTCCIICFEQFQAGDIIVRSEREKEEEEEQKDGEEGEGKTNANVSSRNSHHDDSTARCGSGSSNSTKHECHHVYHKECMVQCLASNAEREYRKLWKDRDNKDITTTRILHTISHPCPTCRHPHFCTITPHNLDRVFDNKRNSNNNNNDADHHHHCNWGRFILGI